MRSCKLRKFKKVNIINVLNVIEIQKHKYSKYIKKLLRLKSYIIVFINIKILINAKSKSSSKLLSKYII